MFRVVIEFDGRKDVIGPPYRTRDEAYWAVAHWRQSMQCQLEIGTGVGAGFSVGEEFGPELNSTDGFLSAS